MEEVGASDDNLPSGVATLNAFDNRNRYIAALDIGTTSVRCIIYDSKAQIKGSESNSIELIYPQPGLVEIDPDVLWEKVIQTIRRAIISECFREVIAI